MKKRFISVLLAGFMCLSTTACTAEGYEPAKVPVSHIDTGLEGQGPRLADYIDEGIQEAKDNGLYTETDYSAVVAPDPSDDSDYGKPRNPAPLNLSGTSSDNNPESSSETGSNNNSGSSLENNSSDSSGNSSKNSSSDSSGNSSGNNISNDLGNDSDSEKADFIGIDHAVTQQDKMFPWLLKQKSNGAAYINVHIEEPCFTEEDLAIDYPVEYYSDLDELGRTQFAFAVLGQDTMPADGEERGDISSIYPSGWEQAKYDGISNGGWLYNRCHLIAWALSDENDNEKNLMTGTRSFNVDGMLPFEMDTLEYLDEHPDNHVMYRATPVYDGKNLLADGLLLEARSLEDNGQFHFCVYIFNEQEGVKINYKTGESKKAK